MNNSAPLLEVHDVAKRFGAVIALKSATLRLVGGEIHALMGANGAGKSTLVKILTGVHPADAGTITINGAKRVFRSPAEARRAGIVSVYQDPALVPDLTIGQNMRLADVPLAKVRTYFTDLGIEDVDPNALARDIPYPILRLIDLARALASNPTLLILDEITAALPANLSERVFAVMRSWRERGNSVIFISHRMAEVGALCDRATVLRDGVTVGVIDTAPGSGERIVSLMLGLDPTKVSPSESGATTKSARQRRSRGSRSSRPLLRPHAEERVFQPAGRRDSWGCGARRSGAAGAVRLHCRSDPQRRRRDRGPRPKAEAQSSWRRNRRRSRAGPGEPTAGAAAAALDPRECGFAACPQPVELGPHQCPNGASARFQCRQAIANRHPCRVLNCAG